MSKINIFRQKLAERGCEYTPEDAEQIYKIARRFAKKARKLTQADLWQLEQTPGDFSKEEREVLIALCQYARERF